MIHQFGLADFRLLLFGFAWTLGLSAIAFVGSVLIGVILLAGSTGPRWLRAIVVGIIQVIEGTPLLGQLFIIYFGLGFLGFDIPPLVASAVGLSLYGSAFLCDIWRGAMDALPKGQWEAGKALGLSRFSQFRDVILPQVFAIATPPTVGFLVQLIKNTSITSIVGMVELAREAQIVSSSTIQVFLVYGLICALYFVLCYPLTFYARRLERRQRGAQ
jgi:polar amino acid transport system permease protein